jgi:hypothetical protein
MVEKVAALPSDEQAQSLAGQRSLQVLNVLWEDTGRWYQSPDSMAYIGSQ